MAGINQNALTIDRVQALLDVEILVTRWASANRDTSKAYNVLRKVYRADNLAEVPHFYQCSWCDLILHVVPGKGTSPLLRHVNDCRQRPANYVLPDLNMNRNQPAALAAPANLPAPIIVPQAVPVLLAPAPIVPAANVDPNAPQIVQVPNLPILPAANIDAIVHQAVQADNLLVLPAAPIVPAANVNANDAPQDVQAADNLPVLPAPANDVPSAALLRSDVIRSPANTTGTNMTQGTINRDQLAKMFAEISQIGLLFGNITQSEMMSILPSADGQW